MSAGRGVSLAAMRGCGRRVSEDMRVLCAEALCRLDVSSLEAKRKTKRTAEEVGRG